MKYTEFKKLLGKQQLDTLTLIEESGLEGVNTVQFRNHEYIQMPTTRVFEINILLEKHKIDKKILKQTEKNKTATYYLADYNWMKRPFDNKTPVKSQPESTDRPYKWDFSGNTARRVYL